MRRCRTIEAAMNNSCGLARLRLSVSGVAAGLRRLSRSCRPQWTLQKGSSIHCRISTATSLLALSDHSHASQALHVRAIAENDKAFCPQAAAGADLANSRDRAL